MRLEDTTVRSLPAPQNGQKLYRDDTLKGFGCRVSQGGTKTFVLVHGGDRRTITIGRYPIISLSKARVEAKRMLAEFTLGKARPHAISYAQATELFLQDKARAKRPSTVYGYRRHLARFKFDCQLSEITPHEISRRLDRIKAASARSHALVAAKVFFNWCIKRRYITDNPLLGLTKPKQTPRDRVLSDMELKAIWNATQGPSTFNRIIRLCILTGQRRGELARLQPEYINGEYCALPGSLTKNGREHCFPLTALSKQHLTFAGFNNWGQAKAALDKETGINAGWVIHDIRRTVATRMAEMGVAPHVIERLLNHISGQISGISAVYNRARYLEEMRQAIKAWEGKLTALLQLPSAA